MHGAIWLQASQPQQSAVCKANRLLLHNIKHCPALLKIARTGVDISLTFDNSVTFDLSCIIIVKTKQTKHITAQGNHMLQ